MIQIDRVAPLAGRPVPQGLSILHATPHYLPSSAGLTTVIRALGKYETAAGHRVSVAAFAPWSDAYGFDWWPKSEEASEVIDGVRVERFRQREVGASRLVRAGARRDLARKLSARMEGTSLDVIHVAGLSGLTYAAAALARARGIPWVLSLYGEEFAAFEGEPRSLFDRLRRRISLGRLSDLLADCAGLTASGRHLAALARQLGLASEVPFLPNGVDVQVLTPPSAEEKAALRRKWDLAPQASVVLSIQGLAGRKGSHNLLNAFARLRALKPDAFLVVIGGGPDLEPLKARAAAEGLGEAVRFLGFQSHEVCVDLYRAADLYLQLPLREEGVSQTALEAQAAGIPVVLGRCPAMEDSVRPGETGLLVSSLDAEEAGRAAAGLLSDPARARHMGEEGRRWVAGTFSYETLTRRYLEVFTHAVQVRRG